MAGDARDRMVEAAVVLLAQKGFQATSFSSVIERSKAPRGSIYHHFPEGKDQMIAAAIEASGVRAIAVVDALSGLDPEQVTDGFLALWRAVLMQSNFTAGCSVLAVTVSADSEDLLTRARRIFATWRSHLADVLAEGGLGREAAEDFAALLVAGAEGAVVMSRADRSLAPFDSASRALRAAALGLKQARP